MLLPGAARAESFEALTYYPPPGWNFQAVQEGRSYVRPDRTGVVVFYAGQPDRSAPAEAFAAMWRAQVLPAVSAPLPQVQLHREGDFTAAVGLQQVQAQGQTLSVSLLTLTGAGRTQGVVGIARGDAAFADLLAFFQGIRVVQAAAPARPAAAAPAAPAAASAPLQTTPIESAWVRGRYRLDAGGSPGSMRFAWEHLVFFKGGLASRRWSSEGFDGLDAAKEAASAESQRWGYFGTRSEAGGVITVRWSNGGEMKLERAGANLRSDKDTPWLPLPPVDKLALDGLYRRGDGKRDAQGMRDFEIRFTPDGRFEENGVLGSVMREGPKQGRGRYRIANYTLHLDYEGGERARVGFYTLEKPHAKSEALYLNTFVFSRAK